MYRAEKNLTFIGQLANGGMKTTFDGDVCKITKGAIIAHGKIEGTLYITSGSEASISVTSLKRILGYGIRDLGI